MNIKCVSSIKNTFLNTKRIINYSAEVILL